MATHIKSLLGSFLTKRKKDSEKYKYIEKITRDILGEESKKYIQVGKITKDTLAFSSTAASFSYEFSLKKNILLGKIQKEFPEIKKIKTEIK